MYTEDLEYVDDWNKVVAKTLRSLSGFWFDTFTSIPWSYLDLQLYMVPTALPSFCFFSVILRWIMKGDGGRLAFQQERHRPQILIAGLFAL